MTPRLHTYDPRTPGAATSPPPALAVLLSATASAEDLTAASVALGPNVEFSMVAQPDLMAVRGAVAWFEGDALGVAIILPEDADEPTIREWRLRILRYAPYVLGLATPETDAAVAPEVYASNALGDLLAEVVADAGHPIIAPAWDDAEVVGEVQIGVASLRTYDEPSHRLAVGLAEVGRAIRAQGGRQ